MRGRNCPHPRSQSLEVVVNQVPKRNKDLKKIYANIKSLKHEKFLQFSCSSNDYERVIINREPKAAHKIRYRCLITR